MSVDSLLTRLTAQQFEKFLGHPNSIHDHATDDETYFEAIWTIPAHAQIQSLIIDEHTLGMFAHIQRGGSIFTAALIEGRDTLLSGEDTFFYLAPEDVKDVTAKLQAVTDADLRDLFSINPETDLAAWVTEYEYEDEAAVLAYQKKAYENILRFYEQAAAAGDAMIIQYE